jgi:hypothetical protein
MMDGISDNEFFEPVFFLDLLGAITLSLSL